MPRGIYKRTPKQAKLNADRNTELKNIFPNVLVDIIEFYAGNQPTNKVVARIKEQEFYDNIDKMLDDAYDTFDF